MVMYQLQVSLSRFFSWLTKLCSSGIYRPVELWQLEDQTTLQTPTKRHHGSCVFTLREMEEATCSFSDDNLLGKGGFGRVYRGTLRSGEVCCFAIFIPSHTRISQKFRQLLGLCLFSLEQYFLSRNSYGHY